MNFGRAHKLAASLLTLFTLRLLLYTFSSMQTPKGTLPITFRECMPHGCGIQAYTDVFTAALWKGWVECLS
ncbi:hypothetical protein [Nitrincola nitratireducens]|uniref:hypothetical protein n=1 Tax=Nitrincola nitratireducens TaxID=1229521 RepID=UPI0012F8E831|nr:hypothetical protein [Nitrincola nitratireducens]